MPNGFTDGGGIDFGGFFAALLGELGAAIAAIVAFLQSLVIGIVNALNVLLGGEQFIFGFSAEGLTHIFKGLKNLMDQVFKVWVLGSLKHLLDLYEKIAKWARKLKVWLDRLRKLQQLQQAQALRRFINLIQRIRQMLVIFRIFHVKFATKLDNWLAGIEGKLVQRVVDLQRKTNELIAWVNLVADPTTLFRQVPLLRSLGRGLRDMLKAVDAVGVKHLFPKQLAQVLGPGVPARPWRDVAQQFHAERQDNSGDWGAFHRQALEFTDLLDQGFVTSRTT